MSTYHSSTASVSRRGRYIVCHVSMLDESVAEFELPSKSVGQVLFDSVVSKLQLLESDYFGLEYYNDESMPCWLDAEKLIVKQVHINNLNFQFSVKFYTPDPELLEEELTRYLFALQIKRDLAAGTLVCQEHTAVLLASFVVQAEAGDYCEEFAEQEYLTSMKLLPNQTRNIQLQIVQHHKEHVGQTPAEADFFLLDTARKVELYGVRRLAARDHDGINLQLAVTHTGVTVFQNIVKINLFSWAKIRKLCFKRKKFVIKLHPDGVPYGKDSVEFYFPSRNWAKNFWKRCIEHHAFFRCHTTRHETKRRSHVVSRGSSFRYTGRTQKELAEYVRENYVAPTSFERSVSLRTLSMLGSRVSTPRFGTLNSNRDFHIGLAAESRTLDRSHSSTFDRVRNVDRSRNGGSFERSTLQENSRPRNLERMLNGEERTTPVTSPVSFQTFSTQEQQQQQQQSTVYNGGTRYAYPSPKNSPAILGYVDMNHRGDTLPSRTRRIDPSQFMLHHDGAGSQLQRSTAGSQPQLSSSSRPLPLQALPVNMNNRYIIEPRSVMARNIADYQNCGEVVSADRLPPVPPALLARNHVEQAHSHATAVTGSQRNTTPPSLPTSPVRVPAPPAPATNLSSPTDSYDSGALGKKFTMDAAYYIVRELMNTERTYKKDLEVIAVWFQDALSHVMSAPNYLVELLFSTLVPIHDFHCGLLKDIENRVGAWEGVQCTSGVSDVRRIGDLLLRNISILQMYRVLLDRHEELLVQLDVTARRMPEVQRAIDEFEAQKICYLPLTTFLLKPVQRLLHYQLILDRLLKCYGADHGDANDCKACLALISGVTVPYRQKLEHIENWQKLIDVQRILSGIDSIVVADRKFVREGCLQKLSRKGLQQRMFFLFSDILLYASRAVTSPVQFRIHSKLSVSGITVQEAEPEITSTPYSFSIVSDNRCLVLVAASAEERDKWMEDIRISVAAAAKQGDTDTGAKIVYPSLKSDSSSEAVEETMTESSVMLSAAERQNQMQHRANATVYVCWHRNTSVSAKDMHVALQNQLSGFLLRKFKNSSGWQKLWVVFTNFCLFFYKSYEENVPLASLPLLGYSVSPPAESDGIRREYVFKLQFKNHIYFFRADSAYTYSRWVEVISSVTSSSHMMRMFSRMESIQLSSADVVNQLPQPEIYESDVV